MKIASAYPMVGIGKIESGKLFADEEHHVYMKIEGPSGLAENAVSLRTGVVEFFQLKTQVIPVQGAFLVEKFGV